MRAILVCIVAVVAALTAVACGGSDGGAVSPQATRGAAARPLTYGTDSVDVTQKLVDASAAGTEARDIKAFTGLYAPDVVYDDCAYGLHLEGRPAVLKEFGRSLHQAASAHVEAAFATRGWAVVVARWDFTAKYGGTIEPLVLLQTRDGKIVAETWYFEALDKLPKSGLPAPTPLASAPGAADTPEAAAAVAKAYATALGADDDAALAGLGAPDVVLTDAATGVTAASTADVQAYYARIFAAPTQASFTDLTYTSGGGWAVVLWNGLTKQTSGGHGATLLEIRDATIARETLYYSSSKVPLGP